ncbi:uncharacterized protein KGF55_005012 [Candida pseudojiufengensis]|uniref:uncharacterized protein n=1 Tax=Candida pseudojiufengensis TaxID=497109 RepID=UPI0022256E76|nr:uncharacterized protein KGF55_005012 [Candida pseudojiufengensis]KAI5959780.1 hypothetical protein KGF55_005012 [Candida pseudojiufengensis]
MSCLYLSFTTFHESLIRSDKGIVFHRYSSYNKFQAVIDDMMDYIHNIDRISQSAIAEDEPRLIVDLPNEILIQILNYLPINVTKQLLLYPKMNLLTQYYIYHKCQYCLQINDDSIIDLKNQDNASDSNAILDSVNQDGYNIIEELDTTSQNMLKHIKCFKNYKVVVNIVKFEDILVKLEHYKSLINEIFYNDRKDTALNINISIKLNYSINNFHDVKDCFFNIDSISKMFNENDLNNIQIDLQLNKQLW